MACKLVAHIQQKRKRQGTATVTFLSAMHVLNRKLSLEAKPHQGCPQKPSTGLLVHKSRGDNAGLGSKLFLPKSCHWPSKELENNCSTTGAGLLQAENMIPFLMPKAHGIQGVMISDTLSQTRSCCSFTNDSRFPSRMNLDHCLSRNAVPLECWGKEAIFLLLPQAGWSLLLSSVNECTEIQKVHFSRTCY